MHTRSFVSARVLTASLACVAAFTLATTGTAQTATLMSPGLNARVWNGNCLPNNKLPAGPVPTPVTLSASCGSASCTQSLVPLTNGVVWTGNAGVTAFGVGSTCLVDASGPVTLTLTGAGTGNIVIKSSGSVANSGMFQGSVDVGADGVSEVVIPGAVGKTVTVPVCFTTQLDIDIHLLVTASYGFPMSGALASLDVQFVPGVAVFPATFVTGQPGCGASLTGNDTPTSSSHALTLNVSGGIPNGLTALTIGTKPASTPLTPACTLWLEPVNGVLLSTDPSGAATWSVVLPVPLRTPPILVQAVPFFAASVTATNWLSVTFTDC